MNKKYDYDSVSTSTQSRKDNNLILGNSNGETATNLHSNTMNRNTDGINIKQFHTLINPKLKRGNHYYVLSRRWYAKWELTHENEHSTATYNPEPIDNSDILDPNNKHLLRANIPQGRYIYVGIDAWNQLYNFCSITNEQLPIKRKAIEASLDTHLTILELYPCFVRFSHDQHPTTVIGVVLSKSESFETLYHESIQLFNKNNNNNFDEITNNHQQHSINLTNRRLWLIDNAGLTSTKIELSNECCVSQLLNPNERIAPSITLTIVITFNDDPPKNGIRAMSNTIDTSWKSTSSTPLLDNTSTMNNNSSSIINNQQSAFKSKSSNIAGNIGLQNLGNTCYMNSAIQCLSHAMCLTNYFLNNKYTCEINELNPLGASGSLARSYGNLMKKLWQSNYDSAWTSCSPNEMKFTIGQFSSQFSGYAQQDSQELLVTLLDGLHEDLNRVRRKPYIELTDVTNKPLDEGAQLAWNVHKARNDSIVVDNFHGQLRSTIQCPSCHTVSVTFDPFVCLSLPLPASTDVKIIVSVTPYRINKNVKMYKFKAPIGCSPRKIIEFIKERVGFTHDNYFVHQQYSSAIVKLSAFPTLNINLKSLTKIDFFEFDPSLTADDDIGADPFRCRWALIRHNVSSPNHFVGSRLFPNSMLIPLPHNFVASVTKPLHTLIIYNAVVKRLREFVENPKDTSSSSFSFGSQAWDYTRSSNENENGAESINLKLLERDDLFTVAKTKYQGFLESSRNAQPEGAIPIIVDINWNEEFNNALFSKLAPYESEDSDTLCDNSSRWDHINAESTSNTDDYTLHRCLESFLTRETLSYNNSWYCPKCKSNQFASKKFDIYKLPKILIIHLKRFSYNRIIRGKITKHIVFPVDHLDMSPYVLNRTKNTTPTTSSSNNYNNYSLFAVSRHIGSLSGGHYTAYAKNNSNNKWYHFDDSSVTEVQNINSLAQDAYLLMYELVTK